MLNRIKCAVTRLKERLDDLNVKRKKQSFEESQLFCLNK